MADNQVEGICRGTGIWKYAYSGHQKVRWRTKQKHLKTGKKQTLLDPFLLHKTTEFSRETEQTQRKGLQPNVRLSANL